MVCSLFHGIIQVDSLLRGHPGARGSYWHNRLALQVAEQTEDILDKLKCGTHQMSRRLLLSSKKALT